MISRIDNLVVLTNELFPGIFCNLTKQIIYIQDNALGIRNGYNMRFINA